ncbi:hypothetical protein MKW98_015353 [Papaver atlanticum]|uniref:Peptidase A1 domain-containing protein n=1 Tax=Papaver atlanticum TaxID=357466 RepID=A0AAD4T3C7_9MAGN|nr:hypothetical protein MKW98_015353 [Papaver atlanticum]
MASCSFSSLLLSVLLFLLLRSFSNAQPFSSSRPRGLVFPVHKDPATLQYVTQISLGATKVPVNFVVDLGGKVSWIHSKGGCSTSLYSPVDCKSPQCSLATKSASPVFCVNNTCSLYAANLITHSATNADLVSGVVTVQPSDVIDPTTGEWISGPNVTALKFPFGCETTIGLLEGLPKGVKGMVSLGRSSLSLASQFSAAFRFPRKFALYLSSADNGFVFFGDAPYIIQHSGWQLMSSLSYTPLLLNPMATESWSTAPNSDYYIDVKSIEIDGEVVRLNKALLSINKKDGVGGTRFSTLDPYTAMQTSIYKAFTSVYIKRAKAMGISRVASVAPFTACFNSSTMTQRPEGYLVPTINLVLPKNVKWQMIGTGNSLVYVRDNVFCLGFVDGGSTARTSIVIGGHQMQYNVLQFDIPRSRLGFSPPMQV